MPSFDRSLDVYQGFNFKKDKQVSVGLVTALTIGGQAMSVDLATCKDPTSPATSVASVLVLNSFSWGTGVSDTLNFGGQISTANKVKLKEMLLGSFTNTEVKINFAVYEFDPVAKKYFKSCYPNAELEGIIEKRGENLALTVADDASGEVQSPLNFSVELGVKPQPKEQSINIAAKDQAPFTKSWGLTVNA